MLLTIRVVIQNNILKENYLFFINSCSTTPKHCQSAQTTYGNFQKKEYPDGLGCSKFGYYRHAAVDHYDKTSLTGVHFLLFQYYICICDNDTCVHGRCINHTCICDPGIKGDACNLDIIDCDTESCLNDGTCIELRNGFACQCLPTFDGPRCQYRRVKNRYHCKKTCLNSGTCVVTNNIQECLCLSQYYGSECQHRRDYNSSLSSIKSCSVLKFRNGHTEEKCLAIGLTLFSHVDCTCHYDGSNKKSAICHVKPSFYTKACSFRQTINLSISSKSPDPIAIYICSINWQTFDQDESIHDIVINVNITQCHLF
ncbi:unnamed protein product [Rotaria magnacalcarata]